MKQERYLLALAKALPSRLRKLGFLIIAILLMAVGALVHGRLHPNRASGTSITDKSIAVLPFEDLSDEKANTYFADGIQDGILTRLTRSAELKVISRTSTLYYKSAPENLRAVARQLGVSHILEGSVRKSGDDVRVNVQLVKTATDSHLWAASFDRKLTDIFPSRVTSPKGSRHSCECT